MKHGMHKDMKRKNYMGGMKVEQVDGIMDGNKAARRESNSDNKRKPMKKGRMVYGTGGEVMPKAKPC